MEPQNQNQNTASDLSESIYTRPGFFDRLKLLFGDFLFNLSHRTKAILLVIAGFIILVILALTFTKSILPALLSPDNGAGGTVSDFRGIIIEETTLLPRTENTAVAVVHLRNPNISHGLSRLFYSWSATSGTELIEAGEGTTYILPDQDKFLVVPITKGLPAKLDFELKPHRADFIVPLLGEGVGLAAVNVTGLNSDHDFVVSGKISNTTGYVFYTTDVAVLLRQPNGQLLAAVSTKLEKMGPGEFRDFNLIIF